MKIIRSVAELRQFVRDFRQAPCNKNKKIGLAPTMGNLHAGHISLTHRLRDDAHVDLVIATIFVNPKQFGENEDFGSYPRTFDADCEKLATAGVEVLYAPTVDEIYPQGFATNISVSSVSQGLCGDARPTHFDGVCTIVTKLLLQALPDVAIFGEKDFQQLAVIRRFTTDLDIPVQIMGSPILREEDGLAMSSRNGYLSESERKIAPTLFKILQETAKKMTATPQQHIQILQQAQADILAAGFQNIDYLEIRHETDLTAIERLSSGVKYRLFVAAILGKARLIDNIPIHDIS